MGDSGAIDLYGFCNVLMIMSGRIFIYLYAIFVCLSVGSALFRNTSWGLVIIVIGSIVAIEATVFFMRQCDQPNACTPGTPLVDDVTGKPLNK